MVIKFLRKTEIDNNNNHNKGKSDNNSSQKQPSIGVLINFIEITFQHGCSPVNLLHIFRTLFSINTSGGLLLSSNSNVIIVTL